MDRTKLIQRFLLFGLTMLFLSAGCGGRGNETEQSTEPPLIGTEENNTETGQQITDTPIATEENIIVEQSNIEPPTESARNLYYGVDENEECPQPKDTLPFSGIVTLEEGYKAGYVPGQLVLSGYSDALDIVEVDFQDALNPYDFEEPIQYPTIGDGTFGVFEVRLYQLVDSETVIDVVSEINVYIVETGIQYAFAEPNYITGDPCPGCSGGILGAPATADVGSLANPGNQFLNQWSYSSKFDGAIGLYSAGDQWTANYVSNNSVYPYTGQYIEIAVFDTVPSNFNGGLEQINWASIPFDLCVWKPGMMIDSGSSNSVGDIDNQDHGLFVTGLAQGVAPEARFFLIESLNANAKGDVISLLFGMNKYVEDRSDRNGTLNNTVINLSLGMGTQNISLIPDESATEFLDRIKKVIPDADWVFSQALEKWPYPSVAMAVALTAYDQEGATIVAAAGNEFGEPIQIPAGFPNVLGVASNTIDAGLSCFSNMAKEEDVAAPGGNGDTSCDVDLVALCSSGYSSNIGACPYAVISLISIPAPGFGYWAGTSMSTPLVSGLAALVLEKCPNSPPAGVRSMIENGVTRSNVAGLGAGIINVEQTLAQGCLSSPTPTP